MAARLPYLDFKSWNETLKTSRQETRLDPFCYGGVAVRDSPQVVRGTPRIWRPRLTGRDWAHEAPFLPRNLLFIAPTP